MVWSLCHHHHHCHHEHRHLLQPATLLLIPALLQKISTYIVIVMVVIIIIVMISNRIITWLLPYSLSWIIMIISWDYLRRPPWRQNASRNYRKGRPIHPFLSHHTLNNKHGEDNDYKNIISDGCSIVDGWMVNWVRYNSYIELWAI